jgi:hypothetical protein
MGPLDGPEVLPGAGKMGGQPLQLFEVKRGQDFQPIGTFVGQLQSDNPMVVMVSDPDDQAAGIGAIDETDSTVVLEEQIVGYLSDRRAARVTVAPYRQQ